MKWNGTPTPTPGNLPGLVSTVDTNTRGLLHKTFTREKTQVKSNNSGWQNFTIDFTIGKKTLWPETLMKGVLFHRDSVPARKSVVAMAAARDCGLKLVGHPPYSPDLAPSGYFPQHEKNTWLGSRIGLKMHEVISAVEDFVNLTIRMRASIPQESKHCNPNGRSVWTAGQTILKINHIWSNLTIAS